MSKPFDPYYEWLGIKPKDQPPDHYKLLGVERFEDNDRVIENAADRQMAHVRTYQTGEHSEASQQVLNDIAAARVTLLDAAKKARYDEQLREKLAASGSGSGVGGASGSGVSKAAAAPKAKPLPKARPLTASAPSKAAGEPNPYEASAVAPSVAAGEKPLWQRPPILAAAGGGIAVVLLLSLLLLSGRSESASAPVASKSVASGPNASPPQRETDEDADEGGPRITNLKVESGGDPPGETLPPETSPAEAAPPETSPPETDPPTTTVRNNRPPVEGATAPEESGRYELRFDGEDSVRILESAELTSLTEPFTAEMWFRLSGERQKHRLMGDLSLFRGDWSVIIETLQESSNMWFGFGTPSGIGGTGPRVPELDNAWHHLAVNVQPSAEPDHIDVQVFFDGSRLHKSRRRVATKRKADDIYLGGNPNGRSHVGFTGGLRGFRLSSGVRYDREFTPAATLSKDASTLVLLDFSRNTGDTIRDLSGNAHDGKIDGAEWARVEGDPAPAVASTEGPVVPGAYALRFDGKEGLQIVGTKDLVREGQYFTAEMWVKMSPDAGWQFILSNHGHNLDQGAMGWNLVQHKQLAPPLKSYLAHATSPYSRSLLDAKLPPPDGRWHHLAISFGPDARVQTRTRIRFHFDGEQVSDVEAQLSEEKLGLTDLCVGVVKSTKNERVIFHGAVRAFRLSSGVRYKDDLSPPETFANDATTLALLDFSRGTGDTLPDLSGNGRDGKVFGAKWVKLDDDADASPAEPSEGASPSTPRTVAENDPVPPEDQREKALKTLKKLFEQQYDDLREPQQRVNLARQFWKLAGETEGDPATEFVLYDQSWRLAAEAADVELAMMVINELAGRFEVERWSLAVEAYEMAEDEVRSTDDRRSLAVQALSASDQALADDRFEAAEELARTALALASRARDGDLRSRSRDARDRIAYLRELKQNAERARKTLESSPDDPEANAIYGKYLAFSRGEWAEGLPHLAKANDERLREAASLELKKPTEAADKLAVADAWWEAGQRAPSDEKGPCLARAKYWYETALPALTGLDKAKVDKRLEDLAEVQSDDRSGSSRSGRGPQYGMVGRILADRRDAGVLVGYRPGATLAGANVKKLLADQNIVAARVEVMLNGVLQLPRDTQVQVRHVGGSPSGGVLYLYVDGREIGAVGDDRTKDTTYTIPLTAGDHAIRWRLTGGELGNCRLLFGDAATGEALPITIPGELLKAARNLPTKAEVDLSSQ